MEDPLIRSNSQTQPKLRTGLFGRAGAITSGDNYEKAAALVDLAEDGEGIPSEVLEADNAEVATTIYFLYTKLSYVWGINLFALILLNFFEVPLWCDENFPNPCGSPEKFYLGDLPYLTRLESLSFEYVILLILTLHTLFPILFMGSEIFWKDRLNVFKCVLVVLLIADTILNTIYVSPSGAISTLPIRLAPYIRVFVVAANLANVREGFKTVIGIIPDFSDVAALLVLFLLFFSWVAFVLFEDTIQGQTEFRSYPETLYKMSILFTTDNNPDVWVPAYKQSRYSSIFFILYIILGVFFITNLVLAVVYDSFKGQLAESIVAVEQKRISLLESTFKLLDEDGRGYLDMQQCSRLFKELNEYRTLPQISDDDMESVFYALDDSGDFQINQEEFNDLCGAISLKFDKSETGQWLEQYPEFYNSSTFSKIRNFVRSKTFEYIIIGMLLLNLITVIVETTLDLSDSVDQGIWQSVELSFGWLYFVEMALKVLVYGFSNYWRSGQNRFDFFITWIIVVGETLEFALPNGLPLLANSEWIRYLLIARLLRLTRVLMQVERFRVKLITFFNLIPNLLPYLGMQFFLMCLYCSAGVQAFGGLVYEGNPKIEGTPMEDADFYAFNFNDYPSGMVCLFNLIVEGSWSAWMDTYSAIWSTWFSVLYFGSFYVIAVLIIFNLVISFVLEAFFAEIDIAEETKAAEKAALESPQDDSSEEAPKSERARRQKRVGKDNRVQNLLNHMLSAELEKTKSSSGHS